MTRTRVTYFNTVPVTPDYESPKMNLRRCSCLLISIIILVLISIFFYSWVVENILLSGKYITANSSQSSLYNFKNGVPTVLSLSNTSQILRQVANTNTYEKKFIKNNDFYQCYATDCMVLTAVCCGDRARQTYAMVKSAVILSKSPLVIELFIEEGMFAFFKSEEAELPEDVKSRVKMNLHIARYPPGVDDETWRKLFKECASIRLFLPTLLSYVDSLIYVDTDVVFLAPVEDIWVHYRKMNESHIAALTPEHEEAATATGWYNRFAKHPYYGKLGVNSGVMLMNLTRMRAFGWEEYMAPIEKEFHSAIRWGDQDIINIIFHFHPDKLYIMGCEYNYRSEHCMYMNICKAIDRNGVFALHGSRGIFVNSKQPVFKAIFKAWLDFDFHAPRQDFYYPVSRLFSQNTDTKSNCGKLRKQMLKNIERLIVL